MGTDVVILGLRLIFVLLLYVFLLQIVLVIMRDLRKTAVEETGDDIDRACLVVVDGGSETIFPGQRFDLEPVTSIGRSPSNTIIISNTFISAEHAILAMRDGQWWLEDLGSTNGTCVNRRPIAGMVRVNFGDVIELGKTRLKLTK
ncbi:MAG: FHA domain-containing protein [Chloroflexi bacterium]|nr:FHA domain-containing protein [Chloroflexota bacterium]